MEGLALYSRLKDARVGVLMIPGRFKKFQDHATLLARVIIELQSGSDYRYEDDYEYIDLEHVAEWLIVAAGIVDVSYIHNIHEDNSYCGTAYDYDSSRGRVIQNVLKEIAIFNFVWGSFESLVKILLDRVKLKERGKVNYVIERIKSEHQKDNYVVGFDEWVDALVEAVEKSSYKEYMLSRCSYLRRHGKIGFALLFIYGVRNKFAHGTMYMPEHEDWSGEKLDDDKVIQVSTRLILLYMQMLIRSVHSGCGLWIDAWWDFDNQDDAIDAQDYLKDLHLKNKKKDAFPLFL